MGACATCIAPERKQKVVRLLQNSPIRQSISQQKQLKKSNLIQQSIVQHSLNQHNVTQRFQSPSTPSPSNDSLYHSSLIRLHSTPITPFKLNVFSANKLAFSQQAYPRPIIQEVSEDSFKDKMAVSYIPPDEKKSLKYFRSLIKRDEVEEKEIKVSVGEENSLIDDIVEDQLEFLKNINIQHAPEAGLREYLKV